MIIVKFININLDFAPHYLHSKMQLLTALGKTLFFFYLYFHFLLFFSLILEPLLSGAKWGQAFFFIYHICVDNRIQGVLANKY